MQTRHQPVARGSKIAHHDMARLLTAEVEPALPHPFDHVPVAHSGAFQPQIMRFKMPFQPEVRHNRRHKGLTGQTPLGGPSSRQQRHDLVRHLPRHRSRQSE